MEGTINWLASAQITKLSLNPLCGDNYIKPSELGPFNFTEDVANYCDTCVLISSKYE